MPTRDAPQRRAALTARRKGDSARPGKKRQPAQTQQFQHGDASQLAALKSEDSTGLDRTCTKNIETQAETQLTKSRRLESLAFLKPCRKSR